MPAAKNINHQLNLDKYLYAGRASRGYLTPKFLPYFCHASRGHELNYLYLYSHIWTVSSPAIRHGKIENSSAILFCENSVFPQNYLVSAEYLPFFMISTQKSKFHENFRKSGTKWSSTFNEIPYSCHISSAIWKYFHDPRSQEYAFFHSCLQWFPPLANFSVILSVEKKMF